MFCICTLVKNFVFIAINVLHCKIVLYCNSLSVIVYASVLKYTDNMSWLKMQMLHLRFPLWYDMVIFLLHVRVHVFERQYGIHCCCRSLILQRVSFSGFVATFVSIFNTNADEPFDWKGWNCQNNYGAGNELCWRDEWKASRRQSCKWCMLSLLYNLHNLKSNDGEGTIHFLNKTRLGKPDGSLHLYQNYRLQPTIKFITFVFYFGITLHL